LVMSNSKTRMKPPSKTLMPLLALALLVLAPLVICVLVATQTVAQAQAQAQVGTGTASTAPSHTPTVPSGERPNLHIYLRDEAGRPITGMAVKLFSFDYNQSNGKYELLERDKGTTDAQFGKVAFDATKVLPGLYYLEMKEDAGAGAVVLPTDPDGAPIGTGGGRPPAEVKDMTTINLFEGSVIYVFHFELRPLIKLPSSVSLTGVQPIRAVYVPSSRRYIYYPEAGSNLSKVSTVTPGPSPTPAPPTPTFTPFVVATRSSTTNNATATRNAQNQTATAIRNVSGSGTGAGVAANPTPTSECRGCIPPNSTAGARATIEAATIAAGLTAGVYNIPAGSEGRSGSGGSGSSTANATPNPNSNSNLPPTVPQTGVATEPQVTTTSSTGTGTTKPDPATVQPGVSSNPTSTSTNANNGSNGQGQGQGLSIVGQGQGQSVTTTTSGVQPQPGNPSGSGSGAGGGSAISNLLPGSGVVPTLTPNGAGATGNVGNGSGVASNAASAPGSTTAPGKEDNNSFLLLLIGVSLLLVLTGGVIALKLFGRGKRKEQVQVQEGNQTGEDAR
jgi:hypothetical protein